MRKYYSDGVWSEPVGLELHTEVVYFASEVDARIANLEQGLREAIESVEMWSGYASKYFQDKHDLAGDLAKLRDYLHGETHENL